MTGGILQGIEDGWFRRDRRGVLRLSQKLEKGEKKIVGVNCLTKRVAAQLEMLRISPKVEREQGATLGGRRDPRDEPAVGAALAARVGEAPSDGNIVPPMLDAVRAEATLGEICGALRTSGAPTSSAPLSDRQGVLKVQAGLATGSPMSVAAASRRSS